MTKDQKSMLLVGGVVPLLLVGFMLVRLTRTPNTAPRFWAVSFLPGGAALATAAGTSNPDEMPRQGELVLWDLAKGNEKLVLRQRSSVRSVASSPDGEYVVIGEFSGATKLVRPTTGEIVSSLPSRAAVNAVAVSSDSKWVASGALDGTITLWQVANRETKVLTVPGEKVLNLAFSRDAHLLAATTRKGKVFLFDLARGGEPRRLEAHKGSAKEEANVEAVAFAPDGTSFATGCQKRIRFWKTTTGEMVREIAGITANVNSIAFSPDGSVLAAVDDEGTLTLWNPATGEALKKASAHGGISFGVAFSPDGKQLATVGRFDFTAKIWDAHTLEQVASLQRTNAPGASEP